MQPLKNILKNIGTKPKRLIGIDINTNSIRLVALAYIRSNYQVEACINIGLNNATPGKVILEKLKKTLEQANIKTKNTAIALSHSEIIYKKIKVDPNLTDKELKSFLQFNVEKYTGKPIGSISFDCRLLENTTKPSANKILQLIYAQKDHTEKHFKLLQSAGLSPKIADVNSYALERAARRQLGEFIGLIAIINIDYGAVLITVIDKEKTLYTHEDLWCQEETQATAHTINYLKIKMHLIFSGIHQPLKQIILTGEKSLFVGLTKATEAHFNIKTTTINPFLGMKVSSAISKQSIKRLAPAMLVSCGLALRVSNDR